MDAHLVKPVIDRVYGFDEVPAAFDHLERGPLGKVVVDVSA
jgi:NADPH:quinone reductase-like Zn-dependent oxidoreductase